jgi:cation transport regulator
MPYKSVKELPDSTKKMPPHAKRIWMSAFNAASKQYDTEERAFAVAFAAVKKLYKQDDGGKWHRIKEAESPHNMDAWLDSILPDILAEADIPEESTVDLTEDDDYEGPGRALEHASELLACGTEVLSEDERGFLASLISRLAKDTAAEEPQDTMDGYREQGPALAQEAYRALVGLSPSMDDADGLPTFLESLKAMIPEDADTSALPDVTADQAKESLEALKVWDLRMDEAGQRHAQWEYDLIDSLIEGLKRLRGTTPTEQKAMVAEEKAGTPEAQMQAGYRESAVPDEHAVELHESTIILQEREGSNGAEWEVVIIQAGVSKNNRMYPLEVLRQAAPLFEGCRVYAYDRLLKGKEIFDHLSDEELSANPQGYARDLVGFLKEPRIVGSKLMATLHVLEAAKWLRDNLKDAFAHGQSQLYGLSIDAAGEGHMIESGGQQVLHVDAIRTVSSTDVVSYPAAGGAFTRLIAGVNTLEIERQVEATVQSISKQMAEMNFRSVMEDALDEAEVPVPVRRRLRARLLAALPQ